MLGKLKNLKDTAASKASETGCFLTEKVNQASSLVVDKAEDTQKYMSIGPQSAIGMVNHFNEMSDNVINSSTNAIKNTLDTKTIFSAIGSKRDEIKKDLEESFDTNISEIVVKIGTRVGLLLICGQIVEIIYPILPYPVRLVVSEDVFAEFFLEYANTIFDILSAEEAVELAIEAASEDLADSD